MSDPQAAAAPATPQTPHADVSYQQLLANAPTVVYSPTGGGKSTLLTTLADYIWERSGELYGTKNRKVLRYVSIDSGGFPQRMASLARLGVCEIYRARNHRTPASTMDKLARGWWPTTFIDPKAGQAPEDCSFQPPVLTRYDQWCAVCRRVVRSVYAGGLTAVQCATCKQLVPQNSVMVVTAPNPSFAHVGGIAIDGLTSGQDWILEEIERAQASGQLGGEKAAIGGVFQSGEERYSGNSRAHVGFGQLRAQLWCSYSASVPGLIVPFHWTALEDQGSDDRSSPIYGPKIAGQARTYQVPSWVGHCLYLRKDPSSGERRIYLENVGFPEEGNITHLAKTRTDPGTMPQYLSDVDQITGEPLPLFTRWSLNYFYREVDRVAGEVDAAMAAKFPDAAESVQRETVESGQLTAAAATAASALPQSSNPAIPAGATAAPAVTGLPVAAAGGGRRRAPAPKAGATPPSGAPPVAPAVAPAAAPEAQAAPSAPATEAPFISTPEQVLDAIASEKVAGAAAEPSAPGTVPSASSTPAPAAPAVAPPAPAPAPVQPRPAALPGPLPTAAPRRTASLRGALPGPAAAGRYSPTAPAHAPVPSPASPPAPPAAASPAGVPAPAASPSSLPPPTARPAQGPPQVS